MISMLLKSCDFQLTESCQQELNSKFGHEVKIRGPSEYTVILAHSVFQHHIYSLYVVDIVIYLSLCFSSMLNVWE